VDMALTLSKYVNRCVVRRLRRCRW